MLGTEGQPGILPCAIRDVFKSSIREQETEGFEATISVSYLEIYNESVNDLFNKEATNLKLTSDEHVSAQLLSTSLTFGFFFFTARCRHYGLIKATSHIIFRCDVAFELW